MLVVKDLGDDAMASGIRRSQMMVETREKVREVLGRFRVEAATDRALIMQPR
jgi:hypothetical protein